MSDLTQIISDLNVTIADIETASLEHQSDASSNDFKRAIGQLKAARTSLVNARRVSETTQPKPEDFGSKEDFMNRWVK